MKAVQIPSAMEMEVIDIEKPVIRNPDEVLVKVKRVGICGSDMHIYHGTNPLATYPRIVGHEVAGEVVEVGSNVSGMKPGDHVVVEPIRYCGECYACRKGRPNVCQSLSVFGVHEDGGLREFFVLPENQLHVVDSSLEWDEIVLAEPYTIGAQAVWRGAVEEEDTVFIQGSGPIGICILKMAKLQGARVIISDLKQERLAFAKENGADEIIHAAEESVEERVMELTNGEGPNVVIDAVCLPSTFELGVNLVSPAGTVVVLGFDERPSSIPQLPITKKEVTIVGSRLQTNQFEKVVSLLNVEKLQSNGFITHHFPISEVQEAFRYVEKNPDQVRKAVIVFD
ncbi:MULTISPECIES: zinc-binding alcohol dehydrogenase family protein [Cytobacillus]|uniref:Oxidoreductase, zinc-binding dehydrogenase family n=1 Tax=Cytobacillus firmus TaxID=1399 RepID=A0A800NEJ0_CYTFI|nr:MULTISPECIES: zinc-binding alcohol dehydrogenase family protein [Cytobacillus]KAF0825345.1 Oxidoreductase, zinc-binding dehydrogenase family [Cytobacillus firmus]MBY0159208.1 zinc-binding alcohol dehydrogenase family protein [Cytobacillus firmus]MCM3528869.1 zinc-binding alcohol dehydrogenase family protein [Cytobacillus oceanisediminis]USK44214.1 zinc-binding alcohol dehydrogenase family protein [Cytobacillus oceanisediminis]